MIIPGIKLVTFDATNTLLKFRIPPWDHYANVAHSYGFTGSGTDIKIKFSKSYKEMMKQHPNFGKDSISWEQWWADVVAKTFQGQLPINAKVHEISHRLIEEFKTPTCWEKADGCMDLINVLKKSGIKIGVISNFDPRLHIILKNLCLTKEFDFILTSYEVGFSKPDKKIFEEAQQRYGDHVNPSQCLHIGDDLDKDYVGAITAGWQALLISHNVDLKQTSPMCVFHTLVEFYEAIKNKKVVFPI